GQVVYLSLNFVARTAMAPVIAVGTVSCANPVWLRVDGSSQGAVLGLFACDCVEFGDGNGFVADGLFLTFRRIV
ncbi:MAG: hypothetical protein KKC79_19335, partial [Gammaproteobacteria bacterium]|nr:hypothetical protein [Gammaproteobacteria bacterium]